MREVDECGATGGGDGGGVKDLVRACVGESR